MSAEASGARGRDAGPYTRRVTVRLIAPAIGIAAGVVSGLFGVGGGIVVVPGLVLLLGFPQRRASGTSMATIVAAAIAALVVFAGSGETDWPAAALLGIGAVAGAWAGARYLDRLPERWLTMLFIVVLLTASVRLAVS